MKTHRRSARHLVLGVCAFLCQEGVELPFYAVTFFLFMCKHCRKRKFNYIKPITTKHRRNEYAY